MTQEIDTRHLIGYLAAHGWQVKEQGSVQVWTYPDKSGSQREIRLSTDTSNPEFPQQFSAAFMSLAEVEGRMPSIIEDEIARVAADVIHIDICSPETQDHALSLENSVRLMQGLQRSLGAAAWATVEPTPYLSGKKPKQVGQYLRAVRIAANASQSDSFEQTVISPLKEIDQETFARRVMLTFTEALKGLEGLAITPALITEKEFRRELIHKGVSANFCDAIALMFGKPQDKKRSKRSRDISHTLGFRFDWSPLLAVSQDIPSSLTLEADLITHLKELSDALRETSPKENFQLQGFVTDLKRSGKSEGGKIVVANITGDEPDKVSMELEADLYEMAIQGHREQSAVICIGTLIKNNKSYELIDPSLSLAEPQAAV